MRGVFLHKNTFGYTVNVDGMDLKLDVSWSQADALAKHIASLRQHGDGRGYARCRHDGNEACFAATVHLDRFEVAT